MISTHATDGDPQGWQSVTLRGDIYDGQMFNIPADQNDITVYDDTRPIRYSRFKPGAPELYTDARIAAMLGGGR